MLVRNRVALIAATFVLAGGAIVRAQAPGAVKWLSIPSEKKALLFQPGSDVQLTLEIARASGTSLSWRAIDQKEKELAHSAAPVALSGDAATKIEIKLGKLDEGFYVIRLELGDGKSIKDRTSVPIAVFGPPPAPDESLKEPFFPVGVYDKYILNRDPIVSNTYLHAICWTLRKAGLNCITSGNTLLPPTTEQLDIAKNWGIRVIVRMDAGADPKLVDHPDVLAMMYGDEPKVENIDAYKKQYEQIRAEHPDRPLLTCVVGDSLGARGGGDPAVLWNALKPSVRLVRCYLIRRDHYDLMHRRVTVGTLPANAIFQMVDSYGDTPWWFVAQTFGQIATETRPESHWGNPTAAELTGLSHLALAHGAKGLVGWALQTHWQTGGKDVPCLVKQDTLAPADEKWQAWLDVAKFVTRFKSILLDAKTGGCEPAAERAELEVIPRQTSDGRRFIYIVNMDTRAPAIESDLWLFNGEMLALHDLVDDRDVPLTAGKWGRRTAHVKLKPGEGRLYQVTSMNGPIAADRIDTKELLPIQTDPIEPMGEDEKGMFKQVQALPAWWRFSPDAANAGETQHWFAADFNDSEWKCLRVGSFWDNQGMKLDGTAWYRTRFTPSQAALDTKSLKLLFLAIDESAWVYLNGELVCTHYPDNTDGWDRSFAIDVAGKLKAGQENVIAVKVLNRTAAGGIYGKVALVTPAVLNPQ